MARPKSNVSTTSTNDEEKIIVEAAETTTEETKETKETTETVEKTEKVEKEEKVTEKSKEISDGDSVKIKCENLAGKSAIGIEGKVLEFDADGFATVDGLNAKRLLTIPGFTLA